MNFECLHFLMMCYGICDKGKDNKKACQVSRNLQFTGYGE